MIQRARAAAAAEIALRLRERLSGGAIVFAGPGNNGGDAWVVARALVASGVSVSVVEPVAAKTPDALAERALALEVLGESGVDDVAGALDTGQSIVIDGLLGTGASGEPRGQIASAISTVQLLAGRGAAVVALDVPSGLDASTGNAAGVLVSADLTLTFGSIKRGHLVNRDACGTVAVLDIGLDARETDRTDIPRLVDEPWVAAHVPLIPADAHKGVRKKLAIVGGASGLAGASVLAARAALRSGIGMVKLVVAQETLAPVHEAEPYALAAPWPADDDAVRRDVAGWADAVVIGPGLGRGDESRALLERVLRVWGGPVLLDADAITLFAGRQTELRDLLGDRPALLTPHVVELARLAGVEPDDVLARRFEIGREVAQRAGAAVLLKGVPTIIASPAGERLVSATGTPALATGGSGDVLSGIAGTLLAQTGDPLRAGAAAAWVHGRAAERVPSSAAGAVRGITLDDVVAELRGGWTFDQRPSRYPVLAELPAVAPRA
jgi:NAD(P)H-hydrate epimerase